MFLQLVTFGFICNVNPVLSVVEELPYPSVLLASYFANQKPDISSVPNVNPGANNHSFCWLFVYVTAAILVLTSPVSPFKKLFCSSKNAISIVPAPKVPSVEFISLHFYLNFYMLSYMHILVSIPTYFHLLSLHLPIYFLLLKFHK